MGKSKFQIGDVIICVNTNVLSSSNRKGPPVVLQKKYIVQGITCCKRGCCKLIDVGLACSNIQTNCGWIIEDGIWWLREERFIKDKLNLSKVKLGDSELDNICSVIEKELSER